MKPDANLTNRAPLFTQRVVTLTVNKELTR